MEYLRIDVRDIDRIGVLWRKLMVYIAENAGTFSGHFGKMNWNDRKKEITGKTKIEINAVSDGGELKGYCVASIDGKGEGEIDSLYIEPELRGMCIGAELLQKCLDWLERENAKNISIHVALGNEKALPFYEKFGFTPRTYCLKKKPVL